MALPETSPLPRAIALTGGIGTGKSTAGNLIKLYGYALIDADTIAHSALNDSAIEVAKAFGGEIVRNGAIDRKMLGNIVFSDKSKREILQKILHPKIKAEILRQARALESRQKPYFVDIPLFFETRESGDGYPISKVLLIYAPREMQLSRLLARDNLTPAEAQSRIDAQMDIEEKRNLADFVIENTGNLAHLQAQIERFLEGIRAQA